MDDMATLQSIFLPRTQNVGGYIFMGADYTLQEFLQRQILGLPVYYRDSVRAIRPGISIFFYNYTTGRLHGVFEATTSGSYNIDVSTFLDINYNDRSLYPAQVRVHWKREFPPLGQNLSSRILQILSVGGDRFRVELLSAEAELIMRIFEDQEV